MAPAFLILFLVSVASAQPWQWERYDGDFYNPTNYPQSFHCVGDFDGDGIADLLWQDHDSYDFAMFTFVGNDTLLRWHKDSGVQNFLSTPSQKHYAVNLDDDPRDEMVIWNGTPVCWKVISTDPWAWEQRNDLLDSVYIPAGTVDAVFGDFDGDGLLNAIAIPQSEWNQQDTTFIFERDSSNIWMLDTMLMDNEPFLTGVFSGDYNLDGNQDFVIQTEVWDGGPTYNYYLNTGDGFEGPVDDMYSNPVGGDLDGDGDWDVASDRNIDGNNLQTLNGTILGRFQNGNALRIVGVRTWMILGGFPFNNCWGGTDFETPRLNGWQGASLGFYIMGDLLRAGSQADLNGDGQNDLLLEITNYEWICGDWGAHEFWWGLFLNSSNPDTDSYVGTLVDFDQFFSNPDTNYRNGNIGNIFGNDHAELFVIGTHSDSLRSILIYEISDSSASYVFELRPSWSIGLPIPTSSTGLSCADIDNDGQSEIFVNGHVYFFRNGHWDLYDILPDSIGNIRGFADFDNDGDLDIFAGNDVWISLSPSDVGEKTETIPNSFVVSSYPNPFNPRTTIQFSLPKANFVELNIYDIQGRLVERLMNERMTAGTHAVIFDGTESASGIYFARIQAGEFVSTTKLVLMK